MSKKLFAILVVLLMFVICTSRLYRNRKKNPSGDVESSEVVTEDLAEDVKSDDEVKAEDNNDSSGTESIEKIKIGISINALSNVHNQKVFEETQAAAKAAGHEVVATNANGMATQQVTDIENLIQQQCEVIIIQNGDTDALTNVVKEAKEKGVYTISMESGWIPGVSAMFALNDFAIASALYPMVAGEMGFEGEIICINHNDHPAIRARRNVQEAVLKEYTGIVNVTTVTSGFPGTVELAYKGVESALQAHPNVKAIWATFDLEAIGAAQACKALGRDDIIIVGVDGEQDALKMIAEGGPIIATVVGDQEWATSEAIKVAEKLVAGEAVQAFYAIPFTIVTAENIDEFYKP